MCKIRQKKYRDKKKLKKANETLEYNDIIRGLKKSSQKDAVINRENLKFNNKAELDYILCIKNFFRLKFNRDNSYFLTLNFSKELSLIQSQNEMLLLFDKLCDKFDIEFIGCPECNKTRFGYHYHFLINISSNYIVEFKTLLHKLWIINSKGGMFIEPLKLYANYSEYIVKFFKSSGKKFQPNYDGLISNMDLSEIDNYDLYYIGRWKSLGSTLIYADKSKSKYQEIINIIKLHLISVNFLFIYNYIELFVTLIYYLAVLKL